ncbi:hypothetical protein [Pseudomonas donghuensis]|uniref:hypothetical protein n=1 Tax=Pseudomonas donghuensis TaxID=1163398 RepID=UPI002E112D29|nr:hypothetical protein VP780_11015 [Pseudomonas donghuensis]
MDENKVDQWSAEDVLERHLAPLLEHYGVKFRGHGRIYVDHQHHNIETAQRILTDLGLTFCVPTRAIRSRLMELGWLKDVRRTFQAPLKWSESPTSGHLKRWIRQIAMPAQ